MGFVDFKIGGQVIRAVKCADDLVQEEMVLQGMIDKLVVKLEGAVEWK